MQLDASTLAELQVLDDPESSSIFRLIDRTGSAGGRARLVRLLNAPLDSADAIARRQAALRFVAARSDEIQVARLAGVCAEASSYIESRWEDLPAGVVRCLVTSVVHRGQYRELSEGLVAVARLLVEARRVREALLHAPDACTELGEIRRILDRVTGNAHNEEVLRRTSRGSRLSVRTATLDGVMRSREHRRGVRELLDAIYLLDALHSMAHPPAGFTYPTVLELGEPGFDATGLFHPLLETPVRVDLTWRPPARLLFLSGPNMSGKTTLMRAAGLAVYLAHLGMAVPAARATLSRFERLFAVMSVRDSLDRGESFYLSEVRRVARLVSGLENRERTFALIDEAFKGTNVSDARDATLLLARGLASCPHGLYLLASHLSEAASELSEHGQIVLARMATRWEADAPAFSYQLEPGISELRLGLTLLEREGVAPALRRFIGDAGAMPASAG